jgi:hypothetical protein
MAQAQATDWNRSVQKKLFLRKITGLLLDAETLAKVPKNFDVHKEDLNS